MLKVNSLHYKYIPFIPIIECGINFIHSDSMHACLFIFLLVVNQSTYYK